MEEKSLSVGNERPEQKKPLKAPPVLKTHWTVFFCFYFIGKSHI